MQGDTHTYIHGRGGKVSVSVSWSKSKAKGDGKKNPGLQRPGRGNSGQEAC